ncbi:hypothetical protein PFAG_02705 [Plasmodium falciparum Santa Lucia]|nr:hypothetical protein PFAG_02705 [Plasmodium falciparum Santa Lucia]
MIKFIHHFSPIILYIMLEKSFKKRIINFFNTISHSSNYYIKLKTNNSHIYIAINLHSIILIIILTCSDKT